MTEPVAAPASAVPVDLTRLEELAESATPGPWFGVTDDHGRHGLNFSVWAGDTDGRYIAEQVMTGAADAEFIAALRNAAPQLLAASRAVERVRALAERMTKSPDVSVRAWGADILREIGGAE